MKKLLTEKPMCYLSHPMRGKKGNTTEGNSDVGYQNHNSQIAVQNVYYLRKYFPEVNWYCPGEVEIPVQTLFQLGVITVDQILAMDCKVIEQRCSGVLVHRWEASSGADIEEAKARELGYPILVYEESCMIRSCPRSKIKHFVESIIEFHNHREA